jgi:hypothetical protein
MPVLCPKCAAAAADGERRCRACGASLSAQTSRIQAGGPAAMIERNRLEREEKERQRDARLRRRWIGHGIAGAIVFFVLRGLLDFAAFAEPMAMVWNVVAAIVLGFPMGFVISWKNADRYQGIMIGGITTAVILTLIATVLTGEFQIVGLVSYFMVGALPGFAIGMHCEFDR